MYVSRNIEEIIEEIIFFKVRLNLCYTSNLVLTFVVFINANCSALAKLHSATLILSSSSSKCIHKLLVPHGSQRVLS